MKTLLRVLLGLIPAVYLAFLVNGNPELTKLNLLFGEMMVPVWLLVLAATLAGAAIASLSFAWPLLRGRMRLRKATQRVAVLEQEVHGLRTLPLAEQDEAEAAAAREA